MCVCVCVCVCVRERERERERERAFTHLRHWQNASQSHFFRNVKLVRIQSFPSP